MAGNLSDNKDNNKKAADHRDANLEEKTIEELFGELDEILEQLESPDTSLEDSFARYEAGMKLVKICGEKIDQVEKKIIVLQGGGEDDVAD